MPHSLDEHEFSGGSGFCRGAPAARVDHAVGEAVDHQRWHREVSQAFGPVPGLNGRDRLTGHAGRIVASVIGAVCPSGNFILVVGGTEAIR